MTFEFDGKRYKQASVHQKTWGKGLIHELELAETFREFDWPWYMPTVREYEVMLDEIPFEEKKVWCTNADRYFESAEAMTKWIDQPSLVPFLDYLAEPDRMRFPDTVVQRMIGRTQQADGTCFETFRRMNVWARK
ncbi:MAG: hypothetical protein P8Z79_22170 [Sedimentisphaerales bacterium]|jgi:trans-aconitate 2-methyltransferase